MKNVFAFLLLFALLLLARAGRAQSVGIGTPTPNAKAVLDLTSTTQGLLIPRLTATQRGNISSPPQGLMVYQTDGTASGGAQTGFWYYAGTGGWVLVNPTGAADNLGNHTATQNLNLTNKLLVGGTAGAPGTAGLSVGSTGSVGIGGAATQGTLEVARGSGPLGTAIFHGTDVFSCFNCDNTEITIIRGGKIGADVRLNDVGGGNVAIGTGSAAAQERLHVASGNIKLGDGAWVTTADDQRLKFGDQNFVTIGETGGDDLLQLRAKDFRFDRSSNSIPGYTGFVGIGPATAAPLTRLSLSPSAVEPKITLFDNGSATDHYGFGVSGGQLNYHVGSTSDNHVFYAAGKNGDGTELARLTGAGRLGVGTNAPFSLLANTATNVVGADGYGVSSKSLTWSSNLVGYTAAVFNANPGAGQNGLAVKVAGANAAALALDVSQGLAGSAGASLLAVRANGYVGLGTANPNATLEVRRGTAFDGTAAFYGTARTSHFSYGSAEDTYLRGGKATSNVFLNDNGGNVGIGTTAVPERLSVAGTVRADINNAANAAVIGANAGTGNFATGVRGTAAGSGYGVQGTAGNGGYGVSGSADGSGGRGVDGFALDGRGVYGSTDSGVGVYAEAVAGNDGIGLLAVANGANPAAIITQNGSGLALDVTNGAIRTKEVNTPAAGTANMLALAYGNVSRGGVVQAGSSQNVSCTHPSPGVYYITVAGETLTSSNCVFMVQLTGIYTGDPLYFQAVSGGKFLVQSNTNDVSFNIIIYKP